MPRLGMKKYISCYLEAPRTLVIVFCWWGGLAMCFTDGHILNSLG